MLLLMSFDAKKKTLYSYKFLHGVVRKLRSGESSHAEPYCSLIGRNIAASPDAKYTGFNTKWAWPASHKHRPLSHNDTHYLRSQSNGNFVSIWVEIWIKWQTFYEARFTSGLASDVASCRDSVYKHCFKSGESRRRFKKISEPKSFNSNRDRCLFRNLNSKYRCVQINWIQNKNYRLCSSLVPENRSVFLFRFVDL